MDDARRYSATTNTVRYAHPGHDLIARESMELRQREDELRDRWKEMGFELPQVSSENETPFCLPDPISVDNHVTVTENNHDDDLHQQDDHQHNGGNAADETDSIPAVTQKPVTSPQLSVTSARQSSVKVRPLDPDDDDDNEESLTGDRRQSGYSPADETPIQREIRLAREREDLLREARGLPAPAASNRTSVSRRSLISESDIDLMSATDASDAGRGTSMRQLATTRLALELEQEKERELDLRRLGCINTISEDRRPPSLPDDDDDAASCHSNGHVSGGAWLIEREVKAAEQRELELQMQRARLSVSDGVTSPSDDVVNGDSATSY